jgi:hypothetical protein
MFAVERSVYWRLHPEKQRFENFQNKRFACGEVAMAQHADTTKRGRNWREIAAELARENDPDRIARLSQELISAFDAEKSGTLGVVPPGAFPSSREAEEPTGSEGQERS